MPANDMNIPSLDWYRLGQQNATKVQRIWDEHGVWQQALFVNERPCVTFKYTLHYRNTKGLWFWRKVPGGSEWVLAKPVKRLYIQCTVVGDGEDGKYSQVHMRTNWGDQGMLVCLENERLKEIIDVFKQQYLDAYTEPELRLATVVDGSNKALTTCITVKGMHKRERNLDPVAIRTEEDEELENPKPVKRMKLPMKPAAGKSKAMKAEKAMKAAKSMKAEKAMKAEMKAAKSMKAENEG